MMGAFLLRRLACTNIHPLLEIIGTFRFSNQSFYQGAPGFDINSNRMSHSQYFSI